MKILVTGGAGFIGSNFIRYALNSRPQLQMINYDSLTYAGNLANLADIATNPRYSFVKGDILDKEKVAEHLKGCDAIINFAAESHVDRSIHGPEAFVRTNVLGTQALLEVARHQKLGRFLQISTDEVYGSLGETGQFTEDSALQPNSPYSASKAAADLLCRSYHHTYGLDVVVTRCGNNFGPYQFPEKLIPLMIHNAQHDKSLPVYGDGKNVRDWVYVDDHNSAVLAALEKGKPGETYNIGSENEYQNINIVKTILKELKKPESLIKFVKDRPGHDKRYALDSSKIRNELGWQAKVTFDEGIKKTIRWYIDNQSWLDGVINGSYLEFYKRQYGTQA